MYREPRVISPDTTDTIILPRQRNRPASNTWGRLRDMAVAQGEHRWCFEDWIATASPAELRRITGMSPAAVRDEVTRRARRYPRGAFIHAAYRHVRREAPRIPAQDAKIWLHYLSDAELASIPGMRRKRITEAVRAYRPPDGWRRRLPAMLPRAGETRMRDLLIAMDHASNEQLRQAASAKSVTDVRAALGVTS